MNGDKIETFMRLAGQQIAPSLDLQNDELRQLGAKLLLSEVLEYVIEGLGLIPQVDGVSIKDPNQIKFTPASAPNSVEMLDGLADTAYTMYWNAKCFGIPLESAFELVCDNNLEKFVELKGWNQGEQIVKPAEWNLGRGIVWPSEVASVQVLKVGASYFAVGKDSSGKVRKPSTYVPVDLSSLLTDEQNGRPNSVT